MPAISKELQELLTQTDLVVFPEDFVVVYLPQEIKAISGEWFRKATTRFAVVIQEPKMVTMVISSRKWLRMQNIFQKYDTNGPWKVISLKVKQRSVGGYRAAFDSALKDSGIRIIPISTLKHEYILVPKDHLPRAVRLLRDFLYSLKKNKKSKG
jgi:hypothetical protein